MDFTDTPNEENSGNPTDPPTEAAEDAATPVNPFFVVNMMIYAVIGLLILIFCVWIPCSQRQNPGITLGRLEEALPFVGSLSQSENAPMLQQPAQDEAAQGGQDPQDVQGLPQAREEAQEGAQGLLQAEEPRDGDVTKTPGVRHVTWNASVVGGNESSSEAASACDDEGEYVSLDELREDPRAIARQECPRASAYDEEHDKQDGCTKSAQAVYSSGHATLQNDGSCSGVASSPSAPSRPPSAPSRPPSAPSRPPSAPSRPPSAPSRPPSAPSRPPSAPSRPDLEDGEYVMLTFLGLPSLRQVGKTANARGPLGAAGQADDVESPDGQPLPLLQSTDEERRSRLHLRRQQNVELPDPLHVGQDKSARVAETESLDDQPVPPVQLTADQRRRRLERQQKVEHPDGPNAGQTVLRSDREASDPRDAQAEGGESLADQSSMSSRTTAEEHSLRQNIEDDIDENDEQEEGRGDGDSEATGLSSWEEESLDDELLTQTAQERQHLRRRQNFDEDDKE